MSKEITFAIRQTGYDSEDTQFIIRVKDSGTAPNIKIYQSGQYSGELTLSERGSEQLVAALLYAQQEYAK